MEDIKDLVSSLTITGMAVLRHPKARKQLLRMVMIQTWKSRRTIRTVLLSSLLGLTLSFVITKYFVYRALIHSANRNPGPPLDLWAPLSGHLRQLLSQDAGLVYRAWAKQYGPVFRYFGGGNSPRVLVADPGLVQHILTDTSFKPRFETQLNLIPTTTTDETDLTGFIPSIIEPTQQLVDQWQQHCNTASTTTTTPTEIVVSQGLRLVALEIFTRTVVGESLDAVNHPHRHAFSRAYLSQDSITTKPWKIWNEFIPRFLNKKKATKSVIEQETLGLVAAASQRRLEPTARPNLVAGWMQEPVSLIDLQQQAMVVLNTGHETIHGVASWCLYQLAQDIDLQTALRADLSTQAPIDSLPLLDNICKEAFRWMPVIPESHHVVVARHGRLARGTHLVISPLVLHFDPRYWGDNADQFLPSRWNHSPANQIDPFVYLPGVSSLAVLELKWVLALLIRHFKFARKPGFLPHQSSPLTCRPLPNMTLLVENVQD